MKSPSGDLPRTRIRPAGGVDVTIQGVDTDVKNLDELLPFLKDARARRKQSSEETTIKLPKVDATRAPKVTLTVFALFVLVTQLQNMFFRSAVQDEFETHSPNRGNNDGAPREEEEQRMEDEDMMEFDLDTNATEPMEGNNLRGNKEQVFAFELPQVETLPPELEHYARVLDPLQPGDVPVLFHIPRTGGSTLKEITAQCLDLVQASEIGPVVDPAASMANELQILTDITHGGRYANVDTTWLGGLERAKQLNLATSGQVDILVTPYFFQAGSLFDADHRGRLFTILRHPIERAVSMYYYMNDLALNGDENMKVALNGMNLEDYAKSNMVENNWMTRFFTNTLGGELLPQHEALARKILAEKFIIGLLSDRQQSLERFIQFFGWKVEGEKAEDCIDKTMGWAWANKGRIYPKVEEGSKVWNYLEEANSFDIRLFQYAQELFRMQAVLFSKQTISS